MVVVESSLYIRQLLAQEPWRAHAGNRDVFCDGTIDWDGSSHWCCLGCGRISNSVHLQHYPAERPMTPEEASFKLVALFINMVRQLIL